MNRSGNITGDERIAEERSVKVDLLPGQVVVLVDLRMPVGRQLDRSEAPLRSLASEYERAAGASRLSRGGW